MSSAFSSLALSPALLTVVAELGYETMTPIQAQTIPLLLEGRDLIGQSKTGSGKTAAFGLPILEKLELGARHVQALVLCPTRELCAQVARALRKLGRRHPGLQVLPVSGGEPFRPQAQALERGVHVVVGTPGRVLDHLDRGTLELRHVTTLVLDEADRMLDMGFEADMEKILAATPERRQSVFFSATFPASIAALSQVHQRDAARVTITHEGDTEPEIRQLVYTAAPAQKLETLYGILATHPHESALVFCNFKASVADLQFDLAFVGVSVDCLHGDLEQAERTEVMAMFRNGSFRVLVATDVVARGIDVSDLDLVVNYELPRQPEVYVHRIGRTGRAGKTGLAISIATPREGRKLGTIESLTGQRLESAQLEPLRSTGAARSSVEGLARDPAMATIQISGGRKHKVRPGDILGALTGEAGGLSADEVGKIEIHDRLSYVAVSKGIAHEVVHGLEQGKIKGRHFRARLIKPACERR